MAVAATTAAVAATTQVLRKYLAFKINLGQLLFTRWGMVVMPCPSMFYNNGFFMKLSKIQIRLTISYLFTMMMVVFVLLLFEVCFFVVAVAEQKKKFFSSFSFAALRFDPRGDLFWWAGFESCMLGAVHDSIAQGS